MPDTAIAIISEDPEKTNPAVPPNAGKNDAPAASRILKGGFSTGENSYKFEISGDGTGAIYYDDSFFDSDDFAHEVNVEELAAEIEATVKNQIELLSEEKVPEKPETPKTPEISETPEIESLRAGITAEILEEVFWEEINPSLEDPFFRSSYFDEERGEEFYCQQGTAQELTEFLRLCLLTEREITDASDYLVLEAETELHSAGIGECGYFSERIEELAEIACAHFQPAGYRYDYNDGCYDRHSGYSMSSESISISLCDAARAPAREKMLAMIELKKKLTQMKVSSETIKKLTEF